MDQSILAAAREQCQKPPSLLYQREHLRDFYFFFFGRTLAPLRRASESPMAMACLRLFTLPPLPRLPERSVPRFRLRIALATVFLLFGPYFLARGLRDREPFFFVAMLISAGRSFLSHNIDARKRRLGFPPLRDPSTRAFLRRSLVAAIQPGVGLRLGAVSSPPRSPIASNPIRPFTIVRTRKEQVRRSSWPTHFISACGFLPFRLRR